MRLRLFFGMHTGTRMDSKTRTIYGLSKRLGITEEHKSRYVRPLPGGDGKVILDLDGMSKEAPINLQMTTEEARICAELVNAVPITIEDLNAWADALGTKFEEAACA
jgi:hypothetical protein